MNNEIHNDDEERDSQRDSEEIIEEVHWGDTSFGLFTGLGIAVFLVTSGLGTFFYLIGLVFLH